MRHFAAIGLLLATLAACTPTDQTAAADDDETAARHAATVAADARAQQATAPTGPAPTDATSTAAPATTSPDAAMSPAAALPAPYEVRGIIDPGLHNLVAFAFKIPRNWTLRQQFTRKWNGAQPVPQVSLKLLAPGGRQQIDFLPERPYYYQDGPTSRHLRQQAASMGMPMPRRDEYELPPMAPLAYITQVLLPNLAQQGLRVQVTSRHEQPARATGPGAHTASAYVDGRLPNGHTARVECVLDTKATNMGGEVYYNWAARPSLTQAAPAELAAAFAHTQAARQSFITNPAWQRQVQAMSQQGQRVNFDVTERDKQAYQDFQRHEKQLNDEVTADRERSQRQIAESRGELLSGQTRYDNPATGERTQTEDRYAHVYQDRNGALHGSHVPLDAAALDWQELQRVELRNY